MYYRLSILLLLIGIIFLIIFGIGKLEQNYTKNLKKEFTRIYNNNLWKATESRSGKGSDLVRTKNIREKIPEIVKKYGIKILLDAPCGDFYWMKEVNLGVEKYIGADIVDELIEKNNKEFSNSIRSFQTLNLVSDVLPKADLILCRDCLVHLTFEDSMKVIANFKRSGAKYLLTTTHPNNHTENVIPKAIYNFWYPLNLQLPPFNFPKPLLLISDKDGDPRNGYLGLWLLEDIDISFNKTMK